MRAVVVDAPGGAPMVREFIEPEEAQRPVPLVAAALNPVDRVVVAGAMPFRPFVPPAVAGVEGVVRAADGGLLYVFAPPAPFGTFADLVPLAGAEVTPVPVGLDAGTAAALGIPGIAAWLALHRAGDLRPGATVLVLGATGAVGRLVVQTARALGASLVVGTSRGAAGAASLERLGTTPVLSDDLAAYDAALGRLAPEGFDLVIDMLWGPVLAATIAHVRHGGRIVQVGNSGGAIAEISAPVFRNRGLQLVGHSNFVGPAQDRSAAYAAMADLAARDEIRIDVEQVPLADLPRVWAAPADTSRKTVLVP